MNKTRIIDSNVEPVTVSEMEAQLRVSAGIDTALINSNIKAARMMVEEDTDRSLITQTWRVTLDTWPSCEVIFLPRGPVQSVTSLKYIDTNGEEQTLNVSNYKVFKKGDIARITPENSWPSIKDQKEAIEVVYVTGYGLEATVPAWAKEAIKAKATELYEQSPGSMDMIYLSLITPHKIIFNYAAND